MRLGNLPDGAFQIVLVWIRCGRGKQHQFARKIGAKSSWGEMVCGRVSGSNGTVDERKVRNGKRSILRGKILTLHTATKKQKKNENKNSTFVGYSTCYRPHILTSPIERLFCEHRRLCE